MKGSETTLIVRELMARAGGGVTGLARAMEASRQRAAKCLDEDGRWTVEELSAIAECYGADVAGLLHSTDDPNRPGWHRTVPRDWHCVVCDRWFTTYSISGHEASHTRRHETFATERHGDVIWHPQPGSADCWKQPFDQESPLGRWYCDQCRVDIVEPLRHSAWHRGRHEQCHIRDRAGLGGRHEPNRDKESTMTAHRFRKRPVEVEAHRFGPDAPTATDTHTWAEGLVGYYDCTKPGPAPTSGVSIDPADGLTVIATLEGALKVQPGDWIVRGVRGELYPVRNDIFEATYEPVED